MFHSRIFLPINSGLFFLIAASLVLINPLSAAEERRVLLKKGQSFLLFRVTRTGLMEDLAAGRLSSRAAYECAITTTTDCSHAVVGCDPSRRD